MVFVERLAPVSVHLNGLLLRCCFEKLHDWEPFLPLDTLPTPTDSLLSCSELESLPVTIHGPLYLCLENCGSQHRTLGSSELPGNR
jgi:hypothetical protein